MEKEELLGQVKVNLRAVIESSKRCLFLHEVPKQYETLTCKPLPFRELGFSSPVELYNSMPDVVYIYRDYQGPVLLTVPRENSAHIVNLVAGQNEDLKSRKWNANRPTLKHLSNITAPPVPRNPPPNVSQVIVPYTVSHPFYIPPPLMFQPNFNIGGQFFNPRQPYYDQRNVVGLGQSTQPHVPESVKTAIRNIVVDYPEGMHLSTLIELMNSRNPWNCDPRRMGYPDWFHFLSSLDGVVKLRNTGKEFLILPIEVQPKKSLSAQRRVSPKLSENNLDTDLPPRTCVSDVKDFISSSSASDTIKLNSDDSVAEKSTGTVLEFKAQTQEVTKSNDAVLSHTTNSVDLNEVLATAQSKNIETKSGDSCTQVKCSQAAIEYEEKAKSVLMKIIKKYYPGGISMGDVLEDYVLVTGHQLDVSKLKHKSAIEFLKDLPDIIYFDRSEDPMECHIWSTVAITNNRNSNSPHSQSGQKSQTPTKCEAEAEAQIDKDLLIKLLQVICSTQNGLDLNGLEELYKDIHDEELDVNSNFSNNKEKYFLGLKDFFEINCVNDHTTIVRATLNGRRWLLSSGDNRQEKIRIDAGDANNHVWKPNTMAATTPVALEQQEVATSDDSLQTDDSSSSDDVQLYESVPYTPLPGGITIDSCFRVYVCTVVHPGKFFIQLEKDLTLLEFLQSEMNATYGEPSMSKQYSISPRFIEENCQIDNFQCVCYFEEGSWKRVEVVQFIGSETAEVMLIDYGSVTIVSMSDLRFPKEQFMTIPRLCFQARLADNKGLSKAGWTPQAKQIFTNLCLAKTFVARFKSTDVPLLLDLIDETETTQVNIIDVLEEEICAKNHGINVASKDTSSRVMSKPDGNTVLQKVAKEDGLKRQLKNDEITMTERPHSAVNGVSDFDSDSKEVGKDSKCQDILVDLKKSPKAFTPSPTPFSSGVNGTNAIDDYKLKNKKEPIQSFTPTDDVRALESPYNHAEDERCFGPRTTEYEDSNAINHIWNNRPNESMPEYFPVIQSDDRTFQIVPLLLMGKQLLVIHLFGVNYLQSFHISRLIWKADILKTMAEALLLDLQCVTIQPKHHLKLFDTISKYNDFPSEMVDGSQPEITLVPIKVLKTVLPQVVYTHGDAVKALLELTEMFA